MDRADSLVASRYGSYREGCTQWEPCSAQALVLRTKGILRSAANHLIITVFFFLYGQSEGVKCILPNWTAPWRECVISNIILCIYLADLEEGWALNIVYERLRYQAWEKHSKFVFTLHTSQNHFKCIIKVSGAEIGEYCPCILFFVDILKWLSCILLWQCVMQSQRLQAICGSYIKFDKSLSGYINLCEFTHETAWLDECNTS